MRYYQYKQMSKQAFGSTLVESATSVLRGAHEITAGAAAAILALAATTGVGIGYTAAKLTSKGKLDIDTAKKDYENSRLNADINYLRNAVNSEYDAFKRKKKPQAARVIA